MAVAGCSVKRWCWMCCVIDCSGHRFRLDRCCACRLRLLPMQELRRSTIEVHPNFSEAPHVKGFIPHLKTGSSNNKVTPRQIIPWPKYPKAPFFKTVLALFVRFWVKGLHHSENDFSGNVIPVGCSSSSMRLAGHLTALRAWCKQCLPGR